nr:MAG: RNA-dependent RNA polymerase [Skomarfal virus 5]
MDRKKVVIPDLRKTFLKQMRLPFSVEPPKHTHPISCQRRNTSNRGIVAAIKQMGMSPYMVSMSKTDKTQGNRFFYNQKDLNMHHKRDQVKRGTCYVMVDVDYYADINEYLRTGLPIAIYTVVPPALSGSTEEATWWFEGNTFVMEVNGGARYEHQLWDHSRDVVSVQDRYKNLIVYEVVSIDLPEDPLHRIVFYSPQSVSKYPYWKRLGEAEPIERLRVAYGDASYLRVKGKQQCCISIAGTTTSVTIAEAVLTAARLRYQNMKNPTMGELQRFLQSHVQDPAISVPVVWELLSSGFAVSTRQRIGNTYVYTPGEKPKSFVALEPVTECDDGTEHGRVLGPPLVEDGEAVVPRGAIANEMRTVEDRVLKCTNKVEPPKLYKTLAREFIERTIPVEGLGVPESYDVVFANQNRPLQRARTATALGTLGATGDTVDVRAFQKKETYPCAKAARNISQVPTDHTLRLSCYTYAMKLDLKKMPWYGAANTPDATIGRLRELATDESLVCKDYSKFDGTVSYWLYRNVARAACKRWVADQYRSEMLSMLDAEINCRAVTENGVKYSSGSSRLSGSPVTSDHNTLINAFTSYVALRNEHTPEKAWELMGLYCGDDGVDRPQVEKYMEKVAQTLGLTVKLLVHKRFSPVDYCGRYFVDPWTSNDSFADFWRTIRRAHISFSDQPIDIARVNRAAGYLVTDGKTPVISNYFRKMAANLQPDEEKMIKDEMMRYGNAWPQENAEDIRQAVCAVSGLDSDTLRKVEEEIDKAMTIDDVPPRLLWLQAEETPGFQSGEEVFPREEVQTECEARVETAHETVEVPRTIEVILEETTLVEEPTVMEAEMESSPQATVMEINLISNDAETHTETENDNTSPEHTTTNVAQAQQEEEQGDGEPSNIPNTTDTSTQTDRRPRRSRRHRNGPSGVLGNDQRKNGNDSNGLSVQSGEKSNVYAGSNGTGVQRLRRGRGGGRGGRSGTNDWQCQSEMVPRLQTRSYPPRRENDHAACAQRVTGRVAVSQQTADQTTPNAQVYVCNKCSQPRRRQRRVPVGSNTDRR